MKTLTRDEFIDLLATKPPSAELSDGSSIEISMNQAIVWFNDKTKRSAEGWVWEQNHYTTIGILPEEMTGLAYIHQIGGSK